MKPWTRLCKLCLALLLAAGLVSGVPAGAVAQEGSVFLQGKYLEVGIAPQGWFGPPAGRPAAVPPGFHDNATAGLGFAADFQRDGWEQGAPPYGGDYLVSGSPYEGFAVGWTAGGKASFFCQANDTCGPDFINTSLTETSAGDTLAAVWTGEAAAGDGQRLRLTHAMHFTTNDLFLLIETRLENTGSVTLHSLEFLRGLDPDNDSLWPGGDFDTLNRVVYQPGAGGNPNKALLRAAGTTHPAMLLFLGAVDSRARASLDRDWSMEAAQTLDAPDAGPRLADEALALAWRLGSLEPGAALTVTYFYAFGTDAEAEALLDRLAAPPCDGTTLTAFGGSAAAGGWTVSAPPAAAPQGSCLEVDLRDPASGPGAGAGMRPLLRLVEVRLTAPDGSPLSASALPVQVCYAYSGADLESARSDLFDLVIGRAPLGGAAWTMQATDASPAQGRLCTWVTAFGYFEVFAPASLPSTGFAPGRVTLLPAQPADKAYAEPGGLRLEIPRLGVTAPILGVPLTGAGWDVSWLGENAGWLEGSALPGWPGNAVLTGHAWGAEDRPGPFAALHTLWYGDPLIVHAWGQEYVYAVRAIQQVRPEAVGAMLKHEDLPWLTLVTCRGYDESVGAYRWRVLVRAALVAVRQGDEE